MPPFKYIYNHKRGHFVVLCILFVIGLIFLSVCFKRSDTFWGALFFAFGTTFSSGAIVSFFDLVRSASETLSNQAMNDILKYGITKIESHRDLEEYYSLMEQAKSIDVCGYSLRGFYQSHKQAIKRLSNNEGFRLRIIMVDPASESSMSRELIEEGRTSNQFKESFQSVIDGLKGTPGVEIYTVDFALSSMIFRIDDVMYVGPHFVKEASKASLTFKLNSSGLAFKQFQDEFDQMCTRGRLYKQAETEQIENK